MFLEPQIYEHKQVKQPGLPFTLFFPVKAQVTQQINNVFEANEHWTNLPEWEVESEHWTAAIEEAEASQC